MFGIANRGREEMPVIEDTLIILSSSGRADIARVEDINDERILAHGEVEYSVPIGDVSSYVGRRGRVFHYPAIEENVTDCKRIAALERSTVLRQITMFEKEPMEAAAKLPIGKMVMIGAAVLVLIIMLAVK
ncbi:hypothetical protein [Paenibacillus sp. YN15]|uniref:hypothetical protein n=1 Tax=Paenibacillus sp. YN15 TaxID=1742774 RepID=UPI000DCF2551|nr:hypothetical protein [Paenibacillus sp. YN15]RAU91541.1 hypothetical protein DQG13_29275 [Paenibacillus sp. YN15]